MVITSALIAGILLIENNMGLVNEKKHMFGIWYNWEPEQPKTGCSQYTAFDPQDSKFLVDCPECKKGTVERNRCIDCGYIDDEH